MTYKQIIKEIEYYEKAYKTAFFINGEHGTNENKRRMLKKAMNKKNAAVSALFDIESLYKENNSITKERINEFLENFQEGIRLIETSLKNNPDSKEQLEDLEEFSRIYKEIILLISNLEKKDFLRVIKYAEEKKKYHLKKDEQLRKKNENNIVKSLINDVNYNYTTYMDDKKKRELRVYHVGTPKEEIESYINLITKEEVKYTLLINAIKDALMESDISKDSVLEAYERLQINVFALEAYKKLQINTNNPEMYFDEDAYNLSTNGFEIYDTTYKNVYSLKQNRKNKLRRNLVDKLQ